MCIGRLVTKRSLPMLEKNRKMLEKSGKKYICIQYFYIIFLSLSAHQGVLIWANQALLSPSLHCLFRIINLQRYPSAEKTSSWRLVPNLESAVDDRILPIWSVSTDFLFEELSDEEHRHHSINHGASSLLASEVLWEFDVSICLLWPFAIGENQQHNFIVPKLFLPTVPPWLFGSDFACCFPDLALVTILPTLARLASILAVRTI